jgi:hypothetical protein
MDSGMLLAPILQSSTGFDMSIVAVWVCWFLVAMAVTVVLMLWKRSAKMMQAVSNHLLLISSGVWILGVVIYIVGYFNPQLNWIAVVPRAIISSFKMFVVANDLARVAGALQKDALYMAVFSVLHFVAAFITFLFVFKMVGYKLKSSLKILWCKWFGSTGKEVHLFWGVNEPSCLMAEDIRANYSNDIIVFVDVDQENEESTHKKATLGSIVNGITITNSQMARLESIGALVDHCCNGPDSVGSSDTVDVFGLLRLGKIAGIVAKCSKVYVYFLSDDEARNVSGALNMQHDITLQKMWGSKPSFYVHARRNAHNEVLDHYSQYDGGEKGIKINVIDSAYLSVATLKQNPSALPVNCVDYNPSTGLVESPFDAMIVGFGGTGLEAFKFLYEFAAFVGKNRQRSPFKCYAFDAKMGEIAGLVKAKMPAIGPDELEMIDASSDSEEFWVRVREILCKLNYIVIAINDDSKSLALAVNLFKQALLWRDDSHPRLKIMLRCYNSDNEKRIVEVKEMLNKSVGNKKIELELFGLMGSLYKCDMILSDSIMREAKEYHKMYEGGGESADEFWEKSLGLCEIERLMKDKGYTRYHAVYDINRRIQQNISNALHRRTKLMLMGIYDNSGQAHKRLEELESIVDSRKPGGITYACADAEQSALLLNLAMVEHERWVASHKIRGYTYAPQNDPVRKHHRCICAWDELDECTQSYDCNVVDTSIKMGWM